MGNNRKTDSMRPNPLPGGILLYLPATLLLSRKIYIVRHLVHILL